jgi:hypothetical protein
MIGEDLGSASFSILTEEEYRGVKIEIELWKGRYDVKFDLANNTWYFNEFSSEESALSQIKQFIDEKKKPHEPISHDWSVPHVCPNCKKQHYISEKLEIAHKSNRLCGTCLEEHSYKVYEVTIVYYRNVESIKSSTYMTVETWDAARIEGEAREKFPNKYTSAFLSKADEAERNSDMIIGFVNVDKNRGLS